MAKLPSPLPTDLQYALGRHAHLLDDTTDAIRLIDGAADGFPDLILETFANRLLVSTRRDSALPLSLRRDFSSLGQSVYWKHLDQHQKTSPEPIAGPPVEEPFAILENGIRYRIDFAAGYSQGIFLDQRLNRLRVRETIQPGQTLLNTFAYTGAFSVAAALAGATTTTLDLSQPYLDWARENFQLNGLTADEHYFCKGDTFHWLQRFAKQGRRFDGIVLDPPTFSRDKKGKVFTVEKDYGHLLDLALSCLQPGGWILACTNCRQLSTDRFLADLKAVAPREAAIEVLPMPPEYPDEPYLKSLWLSLP
ncbi:MAG: class I SAM-dependent methyltransferase [Verrucomicrobiota bacterium JB023]|nr:class I SAM-dependent methyltransferase [Verrucomicrobiota bacterium JB023]